MTITATLANEVHALTTCGECDGHGVKRRTTPDFRFGDGARIIITQCRTCEGRGYSRVLLRRIKP